MNATCVHIFIFAFAFACSAVSAQTLPDQFTVEGRLYSSGVALSGTVDVKFEVVDSSNTSCVLYREVHSGIDLGSTAATQGIFALKLGAGTQLFHPARLSAVFANGVQQNGDNNGSNTSNCSFLPAAGSQRLVKIYVSQDSGSSWTYLGPDTAITTSPTAMVAETLQGRSLNAFIMADSAVAHMNQTDIATIFNASNYTKLTDLLSGASSQYMAGTPSAAVSFNNQRITNLGTPTGTNDAVNKNYADTNIGGKAADTSNVSAAAGDGYVLAWDKTAAKWKAVAPGDSTRLALAGGTMTGTINFDAGVGTALNLNGNDMLATGHITMSPLKTLTFGNLTAAQESSLVGTLTTANAGATWFNSSNGAIKYWSGTAAMAPIVEVNGKTGSTITLNANDLGLGTAALKNIGTAAGEVPLLDGSGKIPMALLPPTKYSDLANSAGSYMNYMPNGTACTADQTLKWDGVNQRWICASDNDSFVGSTAGGDLTGTYPNPTIGPAKVDTAKIADAAISTPKLFPNPGSNRLVATNNSGGATLTAFECATNEILQWNVTGWQCVSVSTALGSGYIMDGGNSRGFTLSIGTNDNNDLNFETNGLPRMTINTAGSVGIGTTAPSAMLDVSGAVRLKPSPLPSTPAAGTLAFDNANAFKYYDGTAWNTIATDVNSIFAQKGSNSDITSLNTINSINAGGSLTVSQGAASSLTIGNTGASASATVQGGSGGLNLTSTSTGTSAINISTTSGGISLSQGTASNILIGNNSSTGNVTLQGSGSIQLASNLGNAGAINLLAANATPSTTVRINSAGTGATAIDIAATNGGIKMNSPKINLLGKVGINSPSPSVSLDLSGSHDGMILPQGLNSDRPSPQNGMIRYNTENDKFEGYEAGTWKDLIPSGAGGDFKKDGSVSMTGNFKAVSGDLNNPGISFSSDVNSGLFSPATGELGLSTSGQERVRIASSGKVGIGTNSPAANLDIRTSSTSGLLQRLEVPSGFSGNLFQIFKSGTQTFTITAGALVYAGGGSSPSPAYSFTTDTGSGMFSPVTGQLAFSAGGSEKMRLDNNGYLGIGTNSPGAALDVNGDVRARHLAGAASMSYVITGSGAGTASLGSANGSSTGLTVDGNDVAFKIQFSKGGTPGGGQLVVVRFKNAYSSTPVCIAGGGDSNAAQVPVYITPTTTDFTLSAPGTLGFSGQYTWYVHCLQ